MLIIARIYMIFKADLRHDRSAGSNLDGAAILSTAPQPQPGQESGPLRTRNFV